jgi:hypothetical protein
MPDEKQTSEGAGDAPRNESGGPAGSSAELSVDFTTFVLSLHESALTNLGVKGAEDGDPAAPDLESAQVEIDLLAMLADKTRGNLTDDEDRLLRTVLYELRTTFVRVRGA